jgi:multiple sugar transport system permease protein
MDTERQEERVLPALAERGCVRNMAFWEYITGVVTGRTIWHREARTAYLFTAPIMVYVAIFFFIPALYIVVISGHTWTIRGLGRFVGFDNYVATLQDPVFIRSLITTLYFTALSVTFTVVCSLGAALLLQSRTKLPFRNMMRALYFTPLLVSLVAVAFIWKWMFHPSQGFLNQLLALVNLAPQGWFDDTNQVVPSLAMVYTWARLGFAMVIFIAGLESINEDYYEAASIDGASRWQKFRNITLPMLNPQIVLVVIIEMITALRTFDLPYVATAGGPQNASRTVVFHIYDTTFQYFRFGNAAAAAVILFLIILTLTLLQRRFLSRRIDT